MSDARAARFKEFTKKFSELYRSLRNEGHVPQYANELFEMLYRFPGEFSQFNIDDMQTVQDKLQEVSAIFKKGKIKMEIDAIRELLFTLHATFGNLHIDIAQFLEFIGKTSDVSQLVDPFNQCGAYLVQWTKTQSMEQEIAVNVFRTLTNIMRILQKKKELENNKRVEYMVNVLQFFTEQIQNYADGKVKTLMHHHVQVLIGYWNPPPSNLQTVHAEAKPVVADLTPHAELTGGSVRVAGLLCELNALRA